jgi:hypothetical protein
MTLWEDGSFLAKGHMHGSGFDPYDFIVQASVPVHLGALGDVIAGSTFRSGHVDGWEPFGDEERSYDWCETGYSPFADTFFNTIYTSGDRSLSVSKAVKNVGIGGAVRNLIEDVIQAHLLGDVLHATGGTLVMGFAIGREMEQLFGVDLGDNGWLGFSILTFANQYWLVVPGAAVVIPMLLNLDDPTIGGKARPMRPEEWKWATQVFGGTLPHPDDIWVTNLKNLGDKPFTSKDGTRYLIHMGAKAYEDPTADTDTAPGGGTTAPGQLFVHELTHVWDGTHSGPLWENEALFAQIDPPNDLPASSRKWTELGIEYKAIAIAEWYRRYYTDLLSHAALTDEYYPYVRDHILAESN